MYEETLQISSDNEFETIEKTYSVYADGVSVASTSTTIELQSLTRAGYYMTTSSTTALVYSSSGTKYAEFIVYATFTYDGVRHIKMGTPTASCKTFNNAFLIGQVSPTTCGTDCDHGAIMWDPFCQTNYKVNIGALLPMYFIASAKCTSKGATSTWYTRVGF